MKMCSKRNKILILPVSVFFNQHMPTRSCDVSFSRNSLARHMRSGEREWWTALPTSRSPSSFSILVLRVDISCQHWPCTSRTDEKNKRHWPGRSQHPPHPSQSSSGHYTRQMASGPVGYFHADLSTKRKHWYHRRVAFGTPSRLVVMAAAN